MMANEATCRLAGFCSVLRPSHHHFELAIAARRSAKEDRRIGEAAKPPWPPPVVALRINLPS